jgi:hypothetical protein
MLSRRQGSFAGSRTDDQLSSPSPLLESGCPWSVPWAAAASVCPSAPVRVRCRQGHDTVSGTTAGGGQLGGAYVRGQTCHD